MVPKPAPAPGTDPPSMTDQLLNTSTAAGSNTTAAVGPLYNSNLSDSTPMPQRQDNVTTRPLYNVTSLLQDVTSPLQKSTTTPPPLGRNTMDTASAKALARQVSAVVGAVVGCVIAAGATGAALGPSVMAIIGQLQVLSQMGKIGGGGGAMGAFSKGFEWANFDLPFSIFPEGNTDGSQKSARPPPGQTAEQMKSDLSTADSSGCGLINGIPLLDKAIIMSSSMLAVSCARAFFQLIVTKCMHKDPWDALKFPNWEGPLLIVHWFCLFLLSLSFV